jgi:carboxypeptidase PM20D1
MKGELAARAVALAALARRGTPPDGDVVLIAESDEESNTADVGMSWLVRERLDLRCDYALNESGGLLLELADGRRVVLISVGEKILTSVRIRVFGRAGHASVPPEDAGAVRLAASVVERLHSYRPGAAEVPSVRHAMGVLGAPPGSVDEATAWAGELHPVLAEMLPVTTRMTVTPTGLRTHEPANVIPPFADVICDCRALPGQTEADIREHVDAALGAGISYELELLETLHGGTESPIETPLYRLCESYVESRLPGAGLLPLVTPGFNDSYWVRRAHGTVAYGFAPVFSTEPATYLAGMHGADEVLDVADLVEMVDFHLHAATAGLAEAG